MSKFIFLEVPDSYDFRKKFSSNQVLGCGDTECGYYTLNLKFLVDHLFYDPRHNDMPREKKDD